MVKFWQLFNKLYLSTRDALSHLALNMFNVLMTSFSSFSVQKEISQLVNLTILSLAIDWVLSIVFSLSIGHFLK